MAKDYFQDILPPGNDRPAQPPAPSQTPPSHTEATPIEIKTDTPMPERSIRNIAVSNRPRSSIDMREPMVPPPPPTPFTRARPSSTKSRSTLVLWTVVGIAIAGFALMGFIATRPTTISITPRTHAITFDQTSVFTAYPAGSAATGTLPYTVQQIDLEESEAVASNGVTHVEEKASGSVTVYNDFAATPMKLIKTTRFSTPDGLIFRTPADVIVPGKKGSTPGSVVITLVADASGGKYNIGPVSRLSIPGLASNAAMSAAVYARSSLPFTGGFSGDRPGVSPDAMSGALSAMRGRLNEAASAALAKLPGVALPGLSQVTYEEMPSTADSPTMTRLHERARVQAVMFPQNVLAAAIAQSTGSDIQSATMHLKTTPSFDAAYIGSSTPALGTDLISILLKGAATVVWDVDTASLAQALANHDKGAFNTIVNGFTGVQEAHARIEPFWSNRFPANPMSIRMIVAEPKTP